MLEKATFGAGCFWHVEETFLKLDGVVSTAVGFMGGKLKNPTYENVCSGETGHAEVVQLVFDTKKISYKKLLDTFWKIHDPTALNRQGPDFGAQYRSVIFYHSRKQKKEATESKKLRQKKVSGEIVTEIEAASHFWKAEEYHQRYLQKRGCGRCHI